MTSQARKKAHKKKEKKEKRHKKEKRRRRYQSDEEGQIHDDGELALTSSIDIRGTLGVQVPSSGTLGLPLRLEGLCRHALPCLSVQ